MDGSECKTFLWHSSTTLIVLAALLSVSPLSECCLDPFFSSSVPKKRLLLKYFGYLMKWETQNASKMSGSAAWTAALLPPSTLSASSCARRCVQYRNSGGWGNNKPPCVFRKGAGVGGGGSGESGVAHRGIFGIVQHHSSLVQDTFFPEVWPLCQANHCQRKGDHHTLDEKEARTEKKNTRKTSTPVGGGWSATQPATALISINGRSR